MAKNKLLARFRTHVRAHAADVFAVFIALFFSIGLAQATTITYTTSGTYSWTAPPGVTSVTVEAWGGGGAGGGNLTNNDGGGGGGGGAYANTTIAVTPGNIYTVTVGSGGLGGTGTGGTGGDSWFSTATTILAKGGTGGAPPVGGSGGVAGFGGAAGSSIGTTTYSGGNGGTGRNSNTGRGGPGGSSAGSAASGTSGAANWSTATAAAAPAGGGIGGDGGNANGQNGFAPASGNGGGGGGGAEQNTTGGNGADGQLTIKYFACTPPSNIPAGVAVSCVCDSFGRASLNPSPIYGGNWVASTSDSTGVLPYINQTTGLLRLTENTGNNAKAATVPAIFPAAGNYISVEFQQYAYDGSGADGIAVTLSDYSIPAVPGAYGGSLGYAQKTGINGFAGGWIGVAMDEYGNYENGSEGRQGGISASTLYPQSVGVRGSGSGTTGYPWLAGATGLNPTIDNRTSTTPSRGYYYQVVVDARNAGNATPQTFVSVNRDTSSVGNYSSPGSSLVAPFDVFATNPAQATVPANWQISFTGSTGGSTNIHEIGGLRICAQTVVPTTGGAAGSFSAIDSAYGTPPLAVQNYLTGHIYTKLVGQPFALNVAALSNGQLVSTYAAGSAQSVTVKLVNNSDSLTNASLDCTSSCTSTCTSKAAVPGGTQTLTFAKGASDKGQKQTSNFTINSAYQKLVAIVSDGTTSACSTDAFAVRPVSVASITSSNATNTGTTGTPIFKAGSGNISLTATTTGVSGNPSNYTGVLKIGSTLLAAASPATVKGILAGTFPAATSGTPSSTATGVLFNYSEVGGFTLPVDSVYDGVVSSVDCASMTAAQCDTLRASTWTGVDSISAKSDCVADSFSNTINATGKYGCNFGNTTAAGPFGRFVPDHFDTVVKYDTGSKIFMPCPIGLTCPASGDLVYGNGFVYSGQPFSVQVTARNTAGATTLNYDNGKTLSKNVTLNAYNAAGGAVLNPPGGNGGMTLNTIPASAFSAGVALTTNTPIYTFTTAPTAPNDIFMRATDTDNVTSLRGASSVEGGIKIVSGRMYIASQLGSELLPLTIPVTAQFWNGSGYVTSSTDSVSNFLVATSPATSTILFNNYQNNLTAAVVTGSPKTVTLIYGLGGYTLTAGPNKSGSVDMTLQVPGGASCLAAPVPLACYLPSNKARATFGVYTGPSEFIYLRETY